MLNEFSAGVMMSASLSGVWLASLVGVLVVQAVWLRASHRRELFNLKLHHDQVLAELHGEFECMREQLLQLQRDQLSVKQPLLPAECEAQMVARTPTLTRQALERQMDADDDLCDARWADGFEDTQVMAHEGQQSSLLLQ